MKTFRPILFWMHLAAGSLAGIVVLIMSLTGVALTYEKQMLEWADGRAWTAPAVPGGRHLSPGALIARVTTARPDADVLAVTLRADLSAPATVTLDGNTALLVDPVSGRIIGEPPQALR